MKQLRIANNLKQTELSKVIGYGQSIVSDWESGKSEPTLTPLIKLANYFNVSLDDLADRESKE